LIGIYLPAAAPKIEITIAHPATSGDSLGVAIVIAVAVPASSRGSIPIAIVIAIAGPTTAPEDAIPITYAAVRSAAVQTTIARIVTVNKFLALFVEL